MVVQNSLLASTRRTKFKEVVLLKACCTVILLYCRFEKYKDVAAGGAAHEAGYDAFMTGEG